MKHSAARYRYSEVLFFCAPALIFLCLFIVLPAIKIVIGSFYVDNLISPRVYTGIENYRVLLSDSNFWKTLVNSLIYVLLAPILTILSLLLAILLRDNTRKNRFFRSVYFLPVITPLVACGIIWKWMYSEDIGVINYLLSLSGAGKIHWLTAFPESMISVFLLTIWRGAGYYMLIFLAGLAAINPELEESAIIDGAGYFRRIFSIIVPQLRPTITLVFVVSTISAIKIFTEIYILTPDAPISNKTLVYFLFRESFERFNFGYASAAGVLLFIFLFGLSVLNIRLMERNSAQ